MLGVEYVKIKDSKPKFSTTEVATGSTWIDGKPIYRRIIQSTVGTINDDINAIGIHTVVSFYGQALSNYGNWFPIPSTPGLVTGTYHYNIDCLQSNTTTRAFQFTFGDYYSASNGVYIVIEYTKKVA